MKQVKKLCFGCKKDQFIWKNYEGDKYCLSCWNTIKPEKLKNLVVETKPIEKIFKKIKPVSDHRAIELALYSKARFRYLKNHPDCEASIRGYCTHETTEIHHKRGKIGKLLYDNQYFLAVCRNCHNHIENNPESARENGWSLSRLEKY